MQITKEFEISYRQELLRKTIHLISLSIPIIYFFITKEIALFILIPITIISIIIDLSSKKDSKFRIIFHKIFGKMLRPHEISDAFTFNGATWVLISACICVLIFPKIIAITSITILIISDTCSALIGRRYGKHPIFVNKSLEGTFAFFVSAFIVVLSIGLLSSAPWTFYLLGMAASIISGIAEALSTKLKLDDNFSIPISVGLVMWGGGYVSAEYFNAPFLNLLM